MAKKQKRLADILDSNPVEKMTEKELLSWIQAARGDYVEGLIPKWMIKRIEQMPGWSWVPRAEEVTT